MRNVHHRFACYRLTTSSLLHKVNVLHKQHTGKTSAPLNTFYCALSKYYRQSPSLPSSCPPTYLLPSLFPSFLPSCLSPFLLLPICPSAAHFTLARHRPTRLSGAHYVIFVLPTPASLIYCYLAGLFVAASLGPPPNRRLSIMRFSCFKRETLLKASQGESPASQPASQSDQAGPVIVAGLQSNGCIIHMSALPLPAGFRSLNKCPI